MFDIFHTDFQENFDYIMSGHVGDTKSSEKTFKTIDLIKNYNC